MALRSTSHNLPGPQSAPFGNGGKLMWAERTFQWMTLRSERVASGGDGVCLREMGRWELLAFGESGLEILMSPQSSWGQLTAPSCPRPGTGTEGSELLPLQPLLCAEPCGRMSASQLSRTFTPSSGRFSYETKWNLLSWREQVGCSGWLGVRGAPKSLLCLSTLLSGLGEVT